MYPTCNFSPLFPKLRHTVKKKQTQHQKTHQYCKNKVDSKLPNLGSFKKKRATTHLTLSFDDTKKRWSLIFEGSTNICTKRKNTVQFRTVMVSMRQKKKVSDT